MATPDIQLNCMPMQRSALYIPQLIILVAMACAVHAQDAVRTVTYDCRALVFKETLRFPSRFGTRHLRAPSSAYADPDRIACIEIADLFTIVQDATDPAYWMGGGVGVTPEETGYLVVRCSDAMHQRVSAALDALRSVEMENVLLECHILPHSAVRGMKSIIPKADADLLLSQVEPHATLIGRARLGGDLLLKTDRAAVHVAELAMHAKPFASSPNPETSNLLTGSFLHVFTERTSGGTLISVSMAHSAQGDSEPVRIPNSDKVGISDGTTIELPSYLASYGLAGAILSDGEAILIGGGSSNADIAYCIRMHRPHPVADQLPHDTADTALYFVRYPVRHLVVGAREPEPLMSIHLDGIPVHKEVMIYEEVVEEPAPAFTDDSRLQDILKEEVQPGKWDGSPFTMNYQSGRLFVRADRETHAAISGKLKAFGDLVRHRFSVEIRYGKLGAAALRGGAAINAEALSEGLPALLGTVSRTAPLHITSGEWKSYIADYNPVLDSEAVGIQPVIGEVFAGVEASAGLVAVSANQVRLHLRFAKTDLDSMAEFDLEDARFGKDETAEEDKAKDKRAPLGRIRKPKLSHYPYHSAPVVQLDEWTMLQATPISGSTDHFALFVRVREN